MKDSVQFTDTNAADDSKGRTWGLEGDLFWILVGGGFAFVMALLLCFSALKMGLMTSLLIAAVPLTLCLAYIFIFRQGKPAGYDIDCLDYWLNGSGFSPILNVNPAIHLIMKAPKIDTVWKNAHRCFIHQRGNPQLQELIYCSLMFLGEAMKASYGHRPQSSKRIALDLVAGRSKRIRLSKLSHQTPILTPKPPSTKSNVRTHV